MASNAIWGIEVGQCALKAIKLRAAGDKVELVAFDVIEHPKILSQPDADADELIKAALEKFVSRNDWQGDRFVIGVPGQQTFARFCKLPPVDQKKIPDIVKFEASQQIPFDMDEVIWDYQVFSSPDSPDVEVGIFAIKRDLIRKQIEYYTAVGIAPLAVQTSPSALYNFAKFDQPAAEGGATVIVDIGAQNTDLVIAEPNSAWSRNIPLGGNNFTDALVKSFKLSFAKAESLKKTAATSKYARQIFQAMRPVFADLVAEIQRSIGFYSSTHRDVQLVRVLGLGNAFRLPGLQKYLENNLTISGGVVKLEKLNQIVPSANVNAPQFADNVLGFGVAYGLALQGLEMSAISASLLPKELARVALWQKKRPYFGLAAACVGMAASFVWARQFMDDGALKSGVDLRSRTQSIVAEAKAVESRFNEVKTDTGGKEEKIKKYLELQKDSRYVPSVLSFVHASLPDVAPEIAALKSGEQLKKIIESDKERFARTNRRQMIIEGLYIGNAAGYSSTGGAAVSYSGGGEGEGMSEFAEGGARFRYQRGMPDPSQQQEASPGATGGGESSAGELFVHVEGRLLFGREQQDAIGFLENEWLPRLKQMGATKGLGFFVVDDDPKAAEQKLLIPIVRSYYQRSSQNFLSREQPTQQGPKEEDPVTGEDMMSDWKFEISFKVKLGEKPAKEGEQKEKKG